MLPPPHGRRTGRYVVEFDAPETDAEVIATCLAFSALMGALADEIDAWAEDLTRRGMPPAIVHAFQQAADDLIDAEHGARRAAANFADYFEDARTIAARGIRIIGTDRRRAA